MTKFTLTIDTNSPAMLSRITHALACFIEEAPERAGPAAGPASHAGVSEAAPSTVTGAVEPLPGDPTAAKKAAAAAKRRAAAAVKKKAVEAAQRVADAQKVIDAEGTAAEADLVGDTGVSIDDLKGAVRAYIEANSIEEVKAIFAEFEAAKISDIPAERYAEVMERLV